MDNLKQNIIKNIAQELDCGFDCYFNVKTSEIISIPGISYVSDQDDFKKSFEQDFKSIENNTTDFIKFAVLESFESFKIMELFVQQLTDQNLKAELGKVLENKKPFQNFKSKVDQSNFRQNWFDFKQKKIEKKVETELKTNKASSQQWL
ncbi:hypothetical protein JJL45_11890 [Tamlana sp. s12]|uniref:Uncharacterized protein n=1 Tax=Pseudotamlana carrageenivorans TaxID=2069432 RepID=A0A2I7SLT3_9FLAO|nr:MULTISPECIES: UPF0158 family protein [Tamlana]AUS06868.1 hypothetical protein C1A40_16090 [Tamlana carrageenivorans]OBQ46705.1 hypothetical protein VQ01_15490 [Tamlana sp. s12]QQY81623.1 hypothetical protein JJL45_11890 [Tamlana sp. s12]